MKKIVIGTMVVFLAALAGVWMLSQRQGLPAAEVLPAHPLVFARLNFAQKHIDQVLDSDFGRNIAAIDVPEVLGRNNFSRNDINDFKRWQGDVARFWANPLMKKFLSKEAAVAVYQDGTSNNVLIALRLTLSTGIVESFSRIFHHWGDEITVSRQKYHGVTVNQLAFKGQSRGVDYVRLRDLVVMAPHSSGAIRQVVDVYQHRLPSLEQDPAFDFVRRNAYPHGDGLVFVNFNLLVHQWQAQMDSAAFPVYGLSYMPGVVSKYKMMVDVDEKRMPSGMRQVLNCPAASNDTLRLVPFDAIAYNWNGCYDLPQIWTAAKKQLAQNPELAQGVALFKQRLERHFHINIRKDVLPLLGHEIGGYLTDVDMEGTFPFPIPRLLVFVKVKDRPAAERLLDKLAQSPSSHLLGETYDHVDIHYLSMSLGPNMNPGYCFLRDYLLAATSRQLLKRSIDAYHDSFRSIVSDNMINQFSLGGSEKFNSVTLMKTAELSRRAQDFLGWVDRYLSGRVTMAAAYQQDGNNKELELDEAIANESAELVLARRKLTQLKASSLSAVAFENQDFINGAIQNLNREEQTIKDDIFNYTQQKEDLSRIMDNYASGAQLAKLTMYNMDNLVTPVLKGLESINAQAVTVRFSGKMLETEFLVK
ncbi:MAG: DUF3352 domain-containing protein [Candidatus Omnitrophica bacterium]|nr:DUF3352 domain-containing protein [Candidatus Omnitrophota bacterium]